MAPRLPTPWHFDPRAVGYRRPVAKHDLVVTQVGEKPQVIAHIAAEESGWSKAEILAHLSEPPATILSNVSHASGQGVLNAIQGWGAKAELIGHEKKSLDVPPDLLPPRIDD